MTGPSTPSMPSITVVIAAYNAEATIGGTLTSVLTQDYPTLDVVVVDDGSKDATSAVVEAYAAFDPRVRLIRQDNAGCSAARNTGLAAAAGEMLAIFDADDIMLPSYLRTAIDTYQAAGGGRRWVDLDAWILPPGGLDPKRTTRWLPVPRRDRQVRAILEGNYLLAFAVFPREMIEEVGLFDTNLPTCEDWDLWARALVHGWPVEVVTTPQALYRWTAGSMSASGENMARGEEMFLQGLRDRYAHLLSPEDRAYLDERIAHGSLGRMTRAADDALRAGDFRTAREGYARASSLAPSDRRSRVKALTMRTPVGEAFWRRRLLAADAATGRDRAGRS